MRATDNEKCLEGGTRCLEGGTYIKHPRPGSGLRFSLSLLRYLAPDPTLARWGIGSGAHMAQLLLMHQSGCSICDHETLLAWFNSLLRCRPVRYHVDFEHAFVCWVANSIQKYFKHQLLYHKSNYCCSTRFGSMVASNSIAMIKSSCRDNG